MATAMMAMEGMGRLFGGGTLAGRGDAQLVEAFLADRDESAFAAIVARHGPMVLATCRAVLRDPSAADDAFQATFLVLARKAGAVRGRDALGGWLHRVAYRTAVQAAREAAKRRIEERKAAEMRATLDVRDEVRDDLRAAIHAEVERLPESLRLPVVLCDLEGRTREQAAEELRWTEWAVRGRLERGRAKLRHRLTARGLAPSAALGIAALAGESAASVPEALASVTVRTALAAAAGRAVGAGAAGLAATVVRLMLADRLRSGAIVAMTAVAVAGSSVGLMSLARRQRGDGQMPAMKKGTGRPAGGDQAKADQPPAPKAADLRNMAVGLLGAIRGDKERSYRGVVVDPAGKPVAGAKVYLLFAPGQGAPQATTGPDGRFAFTARVPADVRQVRVAAEAEGFALGGASKGFGVGDFLDGPPDDGRDLTVKLVEDQAVEGRLVDLEGRPIAGAKVRAEYLFVPKNGDFDAYLRALRAHEDAPDQLRNTYLWHAPLQLIGKEGYGREGALLATTDAQGRFVLRGLGRDRLVRLQIEGPTIRPLEFEVITRPGEPIRVPNLPSGGPRFGTRTFYGPSLQLAASPSRPIEGFVRDGATGEPVAGATVSSYKLADQELGNNTIVQATTGAKGRYRLVGMPRGSGNEVMVIPPAGSPNLPAMVKVDDPPGLGPVTFDIPLYRGVQVEGRVVDEPTGRPVKAWVTYHVAVDNPALEAAPAFREMQYAQSYMLKTETDGDGRFKVVAFPGRGLLSVETMDRSHPDDGQRDFRQDFVPVVQMFHQALAEIDIPKGAKTFSKEIRLDPGREVEGTVVDPDGEPLEGAEVYGLSNLGYWENLPKSSTFKVVAMVASRPARSLVFRHEGRKLAGWADIKGDETGHPRVRLEPWGVVTGRVVDPEGKPRGNLTLEVHAKKPRLGGGSINHQPEHVRTDADGRFRVEGLAPGLAYQVYVQAGGGMRVEKPIPIEPTKPGESRDLGNLPVAFRPSP